MESRAYNQVDVLRGNGKSTIVAALVLCLFFSVAAVQATLRRRCQCQKRIDT